MAFPTVGDVLRQSLMELGVLAAGEPIPGDDVVDLLAKFNRLVDTWNAKDEAIYSVAFPQFTLIPGHQPHTIGPSGANFTWPVVRPKKLLGANLVLNNVSPNVSYPLRILDRDEWRVESIKALTSVSPIYLYYEPTFTEASPSGSIYLWAVPTIAWLLELELQNSLGGFTGVTQKVAWPPGYWDAAVYTLAESLVGMYATVPPTTVAFVKGKAAEHQDVIFSVNRQTPRISTSDVGVQSDHRRSGIYNWRAGYPRQ